MRSFQSKTGFFGAALITIAVLNASLAQDRISQSNRVLIAYVLPESYGLREIYDLLRDHRALERIQEILSPFRSPEELTIKTMECKAINSFYGRQNFKPTVTSVTSF
jgi:hypothetical protein